MTKTAPSTIFVAYFSLRHNAVCFNSSVGQSWQNLLLCCLTHKSTVWAGRSSPAKVNLNIPFFMGGVAEQCFCTNSLTAFFLDKLFLLVLGNFLPTDETIFQGVCQGQPEINSDRWMNLSSSVPIINKKLRNWGTILVCFSLCFHCCFYFTYHLQYSERIISNGFLDSQTHKIGL